MGGGRVGETKEYEKQRKEREGGIETGRKKEREDRVYKCSGCRDER